MDQKSPEATTRVEGAPYPPGTLPYLVVALWTPDLFPTPTPLIYPQTSRTEPRSGVPPPKASLAIKNQSGPCSGTLPKGGTITGGRLHHPGALHDKKGVVNPRGWGYVPVAMCLISLSRVLDLARSWCTASFAIIIGSYDVSPPLLSCNGLSFPFEVILSDWVFKDLHYKKKYTSVMICVCHSRSRFL